MVLHQAGESIECEKCEIYARKIVPSSLQIDKVLGPIAKYDCSRNSSSEIKEELDPKEFKYKLTSNLDLGTKLEADSIFILSKQKRLKIEVVNHSGRHKTNKGIISGFTFAEIKYPLQNVINSIKKRKAIK